MGMTDKNADQAAPERVWANGLGVYGEFAGFGGVEYIRADLAAPSAPEPQSEWLIHKAGRGWYRPNAQGYTSNPAEAGRYSHDEALSYSHPNGWDGPRDEITIKTASEVLGSAPSAPAEVEGLVERLRGPVARAARDLIAAYFKTGERKCLASIPARPDHDADLLLTAGIADAATALTALQAENERLRKQRDDLDRKWTTAVQLAAHAHNTEGDPGVLIDAANARAEAAEAERDETREVLKQVGARLARAADAARNGSVKCAPDEKPIYLTFSDHMQSIADMASSAHAKLKGDV